MSLLEKLKSKGNIDILKIYCKNIIHIELQKLENLIELFLEDTIDEIAEKFRTWKPIKENLAELNIEIFKLVKYKIEKSYQNFEVDYDAKLGLLFSDSSKATKENSESRIMERQTINEFKW
jgi:hypothetical protein